jgi:hypothetical protein
MEVCHVAFLATLEAELALVALVYLILGNLGLVVCCV